MQLRYELAQLGVPRIYPQIIELHLTSDSQMRIALIQK